MPRRLTIATTHDFFGAFAPLPTSYGRLAGGDALRGSVSQLKRSRPCLWIDTGDFSHGRFSPDANDYTRWWSASAELGFDAAALGNHELDFGVASLPDRSAFAAPLLCANASVGLPATAMLEFDGGLVGVIGLTAPGLETMGAWSVTPRRTMPRDSDMSEVPIASLAASLRAEGADVIVVALHDGVDWWIDEHGYRTDPRRLDYVGPWFGHVDLILAGHTLGRFVGHVGRIPVLQPWPMGAELGLADIELPVGGQPRILLGTQRVKPGAEWLGTGSDDLREARETVIGTVDQSLTVWSCRAGSDLTALLARAVRQSVGANAALAYATCGQPAIDGIIAHWPAGPISRAQLRQVAPYTDHSVVTTMIERGELARLTVLTGPRPQTRTTAWAGDVENGQLDTLALAVTSGAAQAVVENLLDRPMTWIATGRRVDDGLREILAFRA